MNGEERDLPDDTTVAQLLEALEVTARGTAVEVNLEMVPRSFHAQHRLREGDRLEVVTLVGGG